MCLKTFFYVNVHLWQLHENSVKEMKPLLQCWDVSRVVVLIKPLALIPLHSMIHTLHSPIYYPFIGLSHTHINTAPYILLSYSTRPQQSFLSFFVL